MIDEIGYYIILANFKTLLKEKLITTDEYCKAVSLLNKECNK